MLKIRTGYSFRHSAGKIDEIISRLVEIKAEFAPITDRASTFGFNRWAKAAKDAGLKPVFGVELAVVQELGVRKTPTDYWTFIAQDDITALHHLIDLATEQFYYQPILSLDQAVNAEGVSICTGHRPILDWEAGPVNNIHIALGPSSAKGLINVALKNGWPLAATGDNRYPRREDRAFYEILTGRNAEMQTYDQHIQSPKEWEACIAHLELPKAVCSAARKASLKILRGSSAGLRKASLPSPERRQTLLQMCKEGAKRLKVDLSDPIYKARLARELDLIKAKDFEDYFYIVSDICQFARKTMIVGPARGSSCGSLACYLLGITTVDPIPFGLIFERFIDINRNDMPDIDIDFSDQQRHLVFEYINDKYGSEYVARLGTVAMYQPRSALLEISGALNIPKWKINAVAESLIERSSGDSRALQTLEDTLKTMPAGQKLLEDHPEAIIACRFEGHPRHSGQHAAGIVIASKPIINYVAVDRRTGAAMCDKKDAEDGYDLLKIDALGLTQLSVFEDCLELAGLPRNYLEGVPLDDPEAFEVLNNQHWSGIFQFNGIALQSVTKQFIVTEFNDIVSVTALARPGPLASGGMNEWVARRNGSAAVSYPTPIFEPYLSDTLGCVLYQEQVMEIGRNIGDLDWGQVTALRKAMSRSLGKEFFDQFGDPWKKGAIAKGVPPEAANKIWDDLCAYGSWSFNKSHSVAYGLISYWCCHLKAHFPFEFAAATLSHEEDPTRQIQLLREMAAEGYDYIPIDPETSTDKWTVSYRDNRKVLVGPLWNVKGIGPKLMSSILAARARGSEVPPKAKKLLDNPKTPIDSLWPIRDAFERIMPDPAARNIHTPNSMICDLQIEENDYPALIFCTFTKINPRDENEAVKIAQRGYEIKDGNTASLNLYMTDDTDMIFGKIDRWKYEKLGRAIVNRGRAGKCLYAVKGTIKGGGTFRMMMVDMVRYIGDMEDGV